MPLLLNKCSFHMKCHGIGVVVFYMLISVNKSSMNCSFKQVTSLISLCYGAPLLLINKTTSVSYTFSLGDIGAFFSHKHELCSLLESISHALSCCCKFS